jgi:hypothetical protein
MKIIKIYSEASKEELIKSLYDRERTNKNVVFNDKRGTPLMKVSQKADRITVTCEFVGGATRDNSFFEGTTRFRGNVKEYENGSVISGVITTAPIFHAFLILFFVASVVAMIVMRGFNAVPICLIIFDVFMHKDEFRKQGIIARYISRAAKRAVKKQ